MKVERGIPLPGKVRSRRPLTYPWPNMKAGDSVFFAAKDPADRIRVRSRARHSAKMWCKRSARHLKPVTRKVEGGIRLWLVDRETTH